MAITYPIPVTISLTGQINDKADFDSPDKFVSVTITGTGSIKSEGSYQDFRMTCSPELDHFDYNILQTQVLGGCCIICAVEEGNGQNLVSMGVSSVVMDVISAFTNKFTLTLHGSCNVANPLNITGTINGGTGAHGSETKPTLNGSIVLTPNSAGDKLDGAGTINVNYNIGGAPNFTITTKHKLTFGSDPNPISASETRTVSSTGDTLSDGTSFDIISSVDM